MSILGGMFAGVTAISAQATSFGIISDNIANTNTTGYKETEARFQTLVTGGQTRTSFTPGGVVSRPVSNAEAQGILQSSTSDTDLAVDGAGFFVVNEAALPGQEDAYLLTRAGSFDTDVDGNLRNTAGFYLQGWRTDTTGTIVNSGTADLLSSLETVNLAQFGTVANPTSTAQFAANLPAGASTGATETTNITIFDSEGFEHLLTFNWSKRSNNTWNYTITMTNDPGTLGATTTSIAATSTMTFNGDGSIRSVDGTTAGTTSTIATQSITITGAQFGQGVNAATISLNWGVYGQTTGMSQFDADYSATLLEQNGASPTPLTSISIDELGVVSGQFANGQAQTLYKLALGSVSAPTELEAVSGNAYLVTGESGDIVLNRPQTGGNGSIESGALENSTVDIAEQFTDLIVTQRAYSAATRIITTGDELLDEIIRVKR